MYKFWKIKKRLFRSSISNYALDSDFHLCFLHMNKEKTVELKERRGDNYHLKKINEYILYRIPTVNNVIKTIEDIHKAIMHQGRQKIFKCYK